MTIPPTLIGKPAPPAEAAPGLRSGPPPGVVPGLSSPALPADLLEQVRGRLRLLAGFFLFAFGFDLVLFAGFRTYQMLTGALLAPDTVQAATFQWFNLGAALASGGLWWAARTRRVSTARLYMIGLAYQVAICFVISIISMWQYFLLHGFLPDLTWVPAVVMMFPLIMPGPPRRMLGAALAAAATAPLALLLLELSGRVQTRNSADYFQATFAPVFAAVFAYFGARIVYGLGREVARARELGSYRLGELLGRGGMGEVYRATHRMLARPAAIKLIRPAMLGAASDADAAVAIRRFRREAEVAASLRSPHTVELYDFGATEDQTLYFVMELLDGMDLETLVRQQGPLPAGRVIHILRQVCESLEEAHARGLVHRDIKPANIHVGRLGLRHDFVKVLDFGLVKSTHPEGPDPDLATGGGLTPGTPAYMAPELALGEPVDGRADLYALGCVAYYLLTGQLVFEAANGLQMIARHVRDTPIPPSARAELDVPPGLELLVLACLAKRPGDRPASAVRLSHELGAIVTEPWGETEAMTWWRVHHPAPGAGAMPVPAIAGKG